MMEIQTFGVKLWGLLEKFLQWIAYRLLRLKISEAFWQKLMQFVKFGLVGVSNTLISYVTFLIAIALGAHYIFANIIGFIVSFLNSFFWNSKVVFRQSADIQTKPVLSFVKSSATYIFTGLVLSNVLLYLQVNLLHWDEVIAPLINLLITIPLNFILNKFWAFQDKT